MVITYNSQPFQYTLVTINQTAFSSRPNINEEEAVWLRETTVYRLDDSHVAIDHHSGALVYWLRLEFTAFRWSKTQLVGSS